MKTLQINDFVDWDTYGRDIDRPDFSLEQWQTCFASLSAGINCNRSINKLVFKDINLSDGSVISDLVPFFENNSQLSEVSLECRGCRMSPNGFKVMIEAFKKCPTLKTINISVRINGATKDDRSNHVAEAFRVLGVEKQTTITLNIGTEDYFAWYVRQCWIDTELEATILTVIKLILLGLPIRQKLRPRRLNLGI